MKLLRFLPLLLLISALVLESDAWFRRRRRRSRRIRTVVPTGCSAPPTLAYTSRSGCYSPYTNGERCNYRCRYGYTQVSGSTVRTCSGGRWTGTNLVCRRGLTCSTPPAPSYTYRSGCSSPYTNGERCTYRCRPGYSQVSGSGNVRTCSGGRWTGTNLVCSRVLTGCSTPPTLAYTYRTGCSSPYTNGESCTYRCHSGYTQVSGSTVRICSGGRWTGTNLVCRRGSSLYCRTAPPGRTINAGPSSHCRPPYSQGKRCDYDCLRGYYRSSGSTTRICNNGVWSGSPLVCGAVTTCPSPPTLLNTIRSGCYPRYDQGEICRYACRPGYSQVSGSTSRYCRFGFWVGTDLVCRRTATQPCYSAPPLRTWSYMYGCYPPYRHGSRCNFGCSNGSPQTGSTSRTCNNGVWTGTPLTCVLPYQ